jgi:putative transposase
VAAQLHSSREKVATWIAHFPEHGDDCLDRDQPRSGRRRTVSTPAKVKEIVDATRLERVRNDSQRIVERSLKSRRTTVVWRRGLAVVAGNVSAAAGAKPVFAQGAGRLPGWEVVWVDGGYEHRIEEWVQQPCPFRVEIIKRLEERKGWQLLPKRWVVDRWRRLAREYDCYPSTSEAKILLARCRLMLCRLTA